MSLLFRTIVFVPVLILAISTTSMGQDAIWDANHGGQYNESSGSGLQSADGNFVILGSSYSFGAGEYDFYLVKTSGIGDTLWTKTIGGVYSEYGYDIVETYDSGLVIVGSTRSYGAGGKDVYIVKTDENGDTIWSKTYGGAVNDAAYSIRETSDSGFVICGTTYSYGTGNGDIYLIRTDSTGDTLWTKTYGGTGGDLGAAVRQIDDNGFIIIGTTGSYGEGYSSIYVVRTDANGNSLWTATYGGTKADIGRTVEIMPDGGFIFGGASASFSSFYYDMYIIRTDSLGDTAWTGVYGGSGDEQVYSITRAADGNYLLAGETDSFGAGQYDIYLVKITPFGDTLWTRTYGGSGSDFGRQVFQEENLDYIIIGETYSFSLGGSDIYMVKIKGESTPVYEYPDDILPQGFALAQNYPNPFNMSTIIEYTLPRKSQVIIEIYNILGQRIKFYDSGYRSAGAYLWEWNAESDNGTPVASGIYFYRLSADGFSETKKMVLIK